MPEHRDGLDLGKKSEEGRKDDVQVSRSMDLKRLEATPTVRI